jgi:hypothetical protein
MGHTQSAQVFEETDAIFLGGSRWDVTLCNRNTQICLSRQTTKDDLTEAVHVARHHHKGQLAHLREYLGAVKEDLRSMEKDLESGIARSIHYHTMKMNRYHHMGAVHSATAIEIVGMADSTHLDVLATEYTYTESYCLEQGITYFAWQGSLAWCMAAPSRVESSFRTRVVRVPVKDSPAAP